MTQTDKNPDDARFAPQTFTVVDPRTFDGNPYEVAERACKQVAGILAVAERMLEPTELMARNAEMERAFANHKEPQGSEWPSSPLGKQFTLTRGQVEALRKKLGMLATASAFDPKNPPKE